MVSASPAPHVMTVLSAAALFAHRYGIVGSCTSPVSGPVLTPQNAGMKSPTLNCPPVALAAGHRLALANCCTPRPPPRLRLPLRLGVTGRGSVADGARFARVRYRLPTRRPGTPGRRRQSAVRTPQGARIPWQPASGQEADNTPCEELVPPRPPTITFINRAGGAFGRGGCLRRRARPQMPRGPAPRGEARGRAYGVSTEPVPIPRVRPSAGRSCPSLCGALDTLEGGIRAGARPAVAVENDPGHPPTPATPWAGSHVRGSFASVALSR